MPLCETRFITIEDNKPLPYFQLRNPLYCIPKPWPHVLINVKNQLTGKTITVEAYPFHTITDLKSKIEDKEGFKVDQQHLLLADQELRNESTLDDCNISVGCTLFLVPDIHKRCRVSVRIPSTRETLALIAEPNTTVEVIKAEVEYLGGIPRKFCTLNFFGENLRNEVKIGEKVYLGPSVILHLVANRDTLHNVGPVGCFKLQGPVPQCGPFLMPIYVCLSDPTITCFKDEEGQRTLKMNQHALLMEVHPTITVEEFKAACTLDHRDSQSIPCNDMQLRYADKILEPCKKLMDYSITRGSVLHIEGNAIQNKSKHCIAILIEHMIFAYPIIIMVNHLFFHLHHYVYHC